MPELTGRPACPIILEAARRPHFAGQKHPVSANPGKKRRTDLPSLPNPLPASRFPSSCASSSCFIGYGRPSQRECHGSIPCRPPNKPYPVVAPTEEQRETGWLNYYRAAVGTGQILNFVQLYGSHPLASPSGSLTKTTATPDSGLLEALSLFS